MNTHSTVSRLSFAFLAMGWLFVEQSCWSQPAPSREHVFLPPTFGATASSLQIEAQARYLVARGDLMESAAIARRIHADAFAKEIENSVYYIEKYIEAKKLKHELWKLNNPDRYQRVENRQKLIKDRMEHQFQEVLGGDRTEMLNWLLVKLSNSAVSVHNDFVQLPMGEADGKIQPEDLALIRFSDGRLSFSAGDHEVLKTSWPYALLAPAFDEARNEYESARDVFVRKLGVGGTLEYQSARRLVKAVDGLLVMLDQVYPVGKRSEKEHIANYVTASRYLRNLAMETHHAIRDGDVSIQHRDLHFEGGTVLELVKHMNRTGLTFADPKPPGERVYRSLLNEMRNLYLDVVVVREEF